MSLTASARSITDDGLVQHLRVDGRHELLVDEPEQYGGTDRGPAPHELLPAALAACVTITVRMYARRQGWELAEVCADVDYDPKSRPRRASVALHLPADLPDERRERLERVAAACPVARALQEGVAIDERVVADLEASPVQPS